MSTRRQKPSSMPLSLEKDPAHHHLAGLLPQTPLGSLTPVRSNSPALERQRNTSPTVSHWLRWAVKPASAFKLLVIPIVLYFNWEIFTPLTWKFFGPLLQPGTSLEKPSNPFGAFFLISHRLPDSPDDAPLYSKGYCDLLFLAYYIVFFSFARQVIAINIAQPIAKYFGIRKETKLDRFGEQFHAVIYWGIMGAWGFRIMGQLPTQWYRTEYFWIDYPHWRMLPELKRYYLMQIAFWAQQLFVLILGLEKPRKDYYELCAHHVVTIWLVGWSYLMNLTYIGNAVYLSMDIPDACLAASPAILSPDSLSKLLNYIQYDRAKVVSFAIMVVTWTYFRHLLNFKILYSVWFEYDLRPPHVNVWDMAEGVYLTLWMKHQIFLALFLLQLLNIFWYFLIMRILYRAVVTSEVDDDRSDDEDDEKEKKKK
ncbi:longevity assurance proteins LAG1 LAC1 [Mycena floridula]|nr:longevity assurance proteins LAG1 LAC1 [Mycena floridula]